MFIYKVHPGSFVCRFQTCLNSLNVPHPIMMITLVSGFYLDFDRYLVIFHNISFALRLRKDRGAIYTIQRIHIGGPFQ